MVSLNLPDFMDRMPGSHSAMHSVICFFPLSCDDGHGDYNRSYDKGYDDFDYADYSKTTISVHNKRKSENPKSRLLKIF